MFQLLPILYLWGKKDEIQDAKAETLPSDAGSK